MSYILAALLAQGAVPIAEMPMPLADPCAAFERQKPNKLEPRHIESTDLVALADIGKSDSQPSDSPFGISPDGQQIAFLVRRANAQENDYCQRLLVAAVGGTGEARELDRGGQFIRRDFQLRKFVSVMAGTAKVITPRWSPDGGQIAFLKKIGLTQQVWLVDSDGKRASYRASDLPDNIDEFAWTPDGKALVIRTRPGIRLQSEAIAREARSGFLFDDRFAPQMADYPIPTEPLANVFSTIEIATGLSRAASAAELELLNSGNPADAPKDARNFIVSRSGTAAWVHRLQPDHLLSSSGIRLRLTNGTEISCDEFCSGVRQIFWSSDGRNLYALQKTSWFDNRTTLLRWTVGEPAPKKIQVTDNEMIGCVMSDQQLICAQENAITPRRLVAIDPDTGRYSVIFDPNPEFRHLKLGIVQKFRIRNAFGVESNADLVLPPNHKPGDRHPLVVVQYASVGFLRGGTGDEFPIHPLAAKGFAVLSFSRPDPPPDAMAAKTERELMQANRRDWSDRRNVQSTLELAIQRAVASGAVDQERMGISGFSDGSTSLQWALINSSLFKVAASGSCCDGMNIFPLMVGPNFTQEGRDIGLGFFRPGVERIWQPLSLTLNADRIDTPILIQNSDGEYEGGLDVIEIFKGRGKAIELFVFPGEPHIKYQPAHRLAMYERSTEWFQFWLMNVINCDPAKAAQYVRWKAMKNAPDDSKLRCEINELRPAMTLPSSLLQQDQASAAQFRGQNVRLSERTHPQHRGQ